MNYIIIGLVLNFLLSIIFYNINENKKITNLYFTGITSFIFFLLNSYWVYIEIDIYNLYLNNIWWYSIPYSMFLFGWLFVIFIYKLYSDKKEKTKKVIHEIEKENIVTMPEYYKYREKVKVTCLEDILKDEFYVPFNNNIWYGNYKIIGCIEEKFGYMSYQNRPNILKNYVKNPNFKHPLKEISDFNYWKVFIATYDNKPVALFSRNFDIRVGELQDVYLGFFLP